MPQPTPRAPQTRDRSAAATGVSGRTVQTAKAIEEKAPDLADRLRAREASVHGAAKEVARREGRPGKPARSRVAAAPEPAVTEPASARTPARAENVEPPNAIMRRR